MNLIMNLCLRLVLGCLAAYATGIGFPELTLPGMFNVLQMFLLVSLIVVPLGWRNILLVDALEKKQTAYETEAASHPVHQGNASDWPAIERSKNGLELAKAIAETCVERITRTKFVQDYSAKKADKYQDSMARALFPAILVSGGVLVGAIMSERMVASELLTRDVSTFIVGVCQVFVATLSFCWTVAGLYGEIDLARDIARAV